MSSLDLLNDKKDAIDITKLLPEHIAVQRRVIADALREKGLTDIKNIYINDILALARGRKPGEICVSGGVSAVLSFSNLYFKNVDNADVKSYNITINEEQALAFGCPAGDFTAAFYLLDIGNTDFIHKNLMTAFVDYDRITWPVIISTRAEGDAYRPVSSRTKTVKKMMIEEKIPAFIRDTLPVFRTRGEIFFVAGLKISDKFRVTSKTKRILKIEVRNNE